MYIFFLVLFLFCFFFKKARKPLSLLIFLLLQFFIFNMDFSDECSMYAMEVRDITCLFLELLFTECVSLKQTIGYWKKKKKLDKWWIFLFWISLGSFSLRGPIYIIYFFASFLFCFLLYRIYIFI